MRKWIARVLVLGLTALPATAFAQYPAYYPQPAYPAGYGYPAVSPQGYYYPPAPPYPPVYPNGYPGAYAVPPAVATPDGPPLIPLATLTNSLSMPPSATSVNPAPKAPAASSRAIRRVAAQVAPAADVAPAPAPRTAPAAPPKKVRPAPIAAVEPTAPAVLPRPAAPASLPDVPGHAKGAVQAPAQDVAKAPLAVAPLATDPAPATDPAGLSCAPACAPRHWNLLAFGDYLLWSLHGADVPYAQVTNGIAPATAVPYGAVSTVSPTYTSGFRGGAGVGLGNNRWIVGTVTYFRTGNSSDAVAPPGLVLNSLLAFPNTLNAAGDSLKAHADYHTTLVMADIDYKCAFVNTDALLLSWFAGGRYVHLDQHLDALYQITGDTMIDSRVNFDGGGPRAGLNGQYRIIGGFYGYGLGALNLIAGKFTGAATQNNVFAGLQGQTTVNENRIVPILELELGFGWMTPNGRIRVQGGYYVSSWYNMMTVPTLQSGIQGANFTTNTNNLRDNIVFDGLVARVQFIY